MSLRPGPEIFESQLQRMIRVLKTGVEYHPANISAAGTRANRPMRAASDFAVVQQKAMGHAPFELSRSAEASLLAAISASRPLVLRSGLAAVDAAALVDEWELHVAQDITPYQMAGGKGKQTLANMWDSPLRLEHDLEDTDVGNPVVAWLENAQTGNGVSARAWGLQQQIERVVAVAGRRILRRPAFAAGLIEPGGGPAHFDQYNNVALVLCGRKRFFIAPHEAMRWVDGERNGERNERHDVHPLFPGAYPQPTRRQWLCADLGPGDLLFLPYGWWHWVESEPHSVMTNVWVD